MSDEILIPKPYADSRVIKPKDAVHVDDKFSQAFRVYRDSPFTVTVQIRTATDKQKRITNATLTKQELLEVADYMRRKAEELSVY